MFIVVPNVNSTSEANFSWRDESRNTSWKCANLQVIAQIRMKSKGLANIEIINLYQLSVALCLEISIIFIRM